MKAIAYKSGAVFARSYSKENAGELWVPTYGGVFTVPLTDFEGAKSSKALELALKKEIGHGRLLRIVQVLGFGGWEQKYDPEGNVDRRIMRKLRERA